jgi:hypothetical protein
VPALDTDTRPNRTVRDLARIQAQVMGRYIREEVLEEDRGMVSVVVGLKEAAEEEMACLDLRRRIQGDNSVRLCLMSWRVRMIMNMWAF